MRVLVAGAGFVGAELARRLAHAEHEVIALRRSPPVLAAPDGLANVRWLACDLGDAPAVRALPLAGIDALAYLVAADARDDAAYRRAYVDGLANLLARLALHSALQRVLFASSTSVYAHDDGSWLDESSPTKPTNFTGQRVLEGEALARAAGCSAIALRLGGIYGPGRTSLIARVRSGAAELPRAPHYTNRIHRDDAARACAHLLTLPSAAACYVGADHDPADQSEVLRWLAARIGAPAPRGDTAVHAAPSGKRCTSALLRATGFAFEFPTYREGYGALLPSR